MKNHFKTRRKNGLLKRAFCAFAIFSLICAGNNFALAGNESAEQKPTDSAAALSGESGAADFRAAIIPSAQTQRSGTKSSNAEYGPRRESLTNKPKWDSRQSGGAFTYSFPFNFPPGRNGMEPNLSLSYNSQNSDNNGMFGYGWSMNLPYIERMNKKGADKLYSDNYFNSSIGGELAKTSEWDDIAGIAPAGNQENNSQAEIIEPANAAFFQNLTGTTTRYYSHPGDGTVVGRALAWNDTRNASVGFESNTTNKSVYVDSQYANGYYAIFRMFMSFDLSALPADSIINAITLYAYSPLKEIVPQENDGNDFIRVVQASHAATSSLGVDDFDQCGSINNPTALANDIDISSDIAINQYNAFVFNSAGKELVKNSAGGWLKIGLREGHDVVNDPVMQREPEYVFAGFGTYEADGTSTDPYLEISYTVSPNPTAPTQLLVNGETNPTNTDFFPKFSAIYNDTALNDSASHYRVQVSASSTDWKAPFWDSGKTALANPTNQGNRSEQIAYSGGAPTSGSAYYWRIKFWDNANNEGAWSAGSNYFEAGNLYGAKTENGDFIKYEFKNNSWIATDKKGTKYFFGSTAAARQDNADETKTYKWMLNETRDTNGNYVKYEYYKNAGQIYPDKIKYTGHGSDEGIFQIIFSRQAKSDTAASMFTGFNVKTNYKINEIKAEINGSLAKKYVLNYVAGDNGSRLLLQSAAEKGMDENNRETSMPPTEFQYQKKNRAWTQNNNYLNFPVFVSENDCDNGVRMADINGDGLLDILFKNIFNSGAYINKGDGTGWATSTNFSNFPAISDVEKCQDQGVVFADINGDGFADWLQSIKVNGNEEKSVGINNGNNTGWTRDDKYTGYPIIMQEGNDQGVRMADINGDGLPDFIKRLGPETGKAYINKGDGTGWEENSNYTVPEPLYGDENYWHDAGTRVFDANGDGLADIIRSYAGSIRRVYINKGDGTGWAIDTGYSGIPEFTAGDSYAYEKGARIADVNGDGLLDFVTGRDNSYTNPEKYVSINKGDGTGWYHDNSYSSNDIFIFVAANGTDRGTRLEDISGDGLPDFFQSGRGGVKKIAIAQGHNADLLQEIHANGKKKLGVAYKSSANYLDQNKQLLNPESPFALQTAHQIAESNGLGDIATTTYEYYSGDYYYSNPLDKKFAGFGKIQEKNGNNHISNFYYHQGNSSASSVGEYNDHYSKIGKIYRTENYDGSNHLYAKTITKWENHNLKPGRDFVKLARTADFAYDGDADHKEKAATFDYDNANGNLKEKIFWGEVSGNDDGSFTDMGSDLTSTSITYASNYSSYIMGLQSAESVKDQSGNRTRATKYYYDQLAGGEADKGNLTKEEKWKSGENYVDIEKIYNDYGLVIKIKDPRDKETDLTYDIYNLHVAILTNPLNHKNQYYYDYSCGNPKKIIDPNNMVFETVFDGLDRITALKQPDIADPSSSVTKTAFTYFDNVFPTAIKQTDYLSAVSSFDRYSYFDALNRLIQERKQTEENNWFAAKDYIYDKTGLLAGETMPYLSVGAAATSATTNNNLYSKYSFDPLRRMISVANSVGTTTKSYDDWKITITDPENKIKDLYYDAYNNLSRVSEHNGTEIYNTYYDYDKNGNLAKITDALNNVRYFTYDGLNQRLIAQDLHAPADQNFGIWTYSYDDAGNLASQIDPKNQNIVFAYDDINRVLSEDYTGQTGVEITYGYDWCANGKGRLCSATSKNNISEKSYNALGLEKSETLRLGSNVYSTKYNYDRQGNYTSIVLPDNTEIKYDYNSAGLPESISKKENGANNYIGIINDIGYNAAEQMTYQTFHNGVKSYYTYDADKLNRLIRKHTVYGNSSSAAGTHSVKINARGGYGDIYVDVDHNWNARHDAAVGTVYTRAPNTARSGNYSHDQLWRTFLPFDTSSLPDDAIISKAALNIYVDFMFSGGDFGIVQTNQASITALTGDDYDACGSTHKPVEGTDKRTNITSIGNKSFVLNSTGKKWINKTGYTKLGIREAADLDDTTTYSDKFIRFHSSEQGGASTDPYLEIEYTISSPNDYYQDLNYVYDKSGNITLADDKSNTNSRKTAKYAYDDLHRLISASSANAANNQNYAQTYSYNAIGNIMSKSDIGNYSYSDNGYNNPHAAVAIGGNAHIYDNNGNLISDGTWTHGWDYDNRLIDSENSSSAINYIYDHSGNRLTYSDGTATTTYVNKYFNISNSGTITKNLFLGDQLIATIEANGTSTNAYYVHTDHLGGSNVMTDENGAIVQLLDYYPFGGIRLNEKKGGFDENRKYTGHVFDDKTELNYMGARYQDGREGRFMSQDPLDGDLSNPQTLNKYSYVRNNPLAFIDPLGLRAETPHEVDVAIQMNSLFTQALDSGNQQAASMYANAFNTYNSTIFGLPSGGDPASFTIMNDAIFKWYDAQKGYDNGNWLNTTPAQSKHYSTLPAGNNTCSAFVGEVLADSIGYRNYQWGERNGEPYNYPPNTTNWLSGNVSGFSKVESPQPGDVAIFSQGELFGNRTPLSYGHAGIYFGNNLYISSNTNDLTRTQSGDVILKQVPGDSFARTVYYYRY